MSLSSSVLLYIYICDICVLFCTCLCLRKKIDAIIASQKPILDPQHPEILEEARYWCFTAAQRAEKNLHSIEARAQANIRATGDTLESMASGINMSSGLVGSQVDVRKMLDLSASTASGSSQPLAKAGAKKKAKAKAKSKPVQPQEPQTWEEKQDAACAFAFISVACL